MATKWISHRGESYDAPENTVPAFRLSQEKKTDGMECDIYMGSVDIKKQAPNVARMKPLGASSGKMAHQSRMCRIFLIGNKKGRDDYAGI